jgi:hypothetical protein
MLLHAKNFEMYASLFEQLDGYNEAQDLSTTKYKNEDWAVRDLKSVGENVKK